VTRDAWALSISVDLPTVTAVAVTRACGKLEEARNVLTPARSAATSFNLARAHTRSSSIIAMVVGMAAGPTDRRQSSCGTASKSIATGNGPFWLHA
jgi:hypothetical protein